MDRACLFADCERRRTDTAANACLRSYPSVTQTTGTFNASGPSVESASDSNKTSGLSGGKLAAAVAVPLAVAAIAVLAYVAWNRTRKRPERKRFSAVSHLTSTRLAIWLSNSVGGQH